MSMHLVTENGVRSSGLTPAQADELVRVRLAEKAKDLDQTLDVALAEAREDLKKHSRRFRIFR